tara:strand:- start:438 stop:1079 length:642 start_codon:yes stop_codon:yes gene_type:complete
MQMSLVKKINLDSLIHFSQDNSYLSIVERDKPDDADAFFQELLEEPFNLNKIVAKKTILQDIKRVLDKNLSKKVQANKFYNIWLKDMEKIINLFCITIRENFLNYTLETSRGCKRFHIDNVPIRLLVTYHGKGTEWFPSYACDYSAYYSGKKNEKIIINQKERKFIDPWHVAIFKGQKSCGGEKGILHRTPEEAINGRSVLMRLDYADTIKID